VTDLFDAAGPLLPAYRGVDWAATPLGPVGSWSPTLRAAVGTTLGSRNPVTLLWGPEFVLVYNHAYAGMIGDKHPDALGRPAAAVFPEIWDEIGPMLESVYAGRGATWVEDMKLLMDRHGYRGEGYFTFSYSALHGPDGAVEGIIDIATETTGHVLALRRLELLHELHDRIAGSDDVAELLDRALPVLRAHPEDLPGVRIVLGEPAGPAGVRIEGRTARVRLGADAHLVTGLPEHLPADDGYVRFLRLTGAALTQVLHRIRIRQDERRTVVLERQLSEALQASLLTDPVQPEHLQVAVRYQPAAAGAHIGGDWYDTFLLPGGRLTVVVGDVTGHDRHAAAAMSQVRNLLRGIAHASARPPAGVLTALNDAMTGLRTDALATVILAQLDLGTYEVSWANAGHPPPVLLAPDGSVHVLEAAPETMLGIRHRTRRANHHTALAPGAALVLYTDGLIERRAGSLDTGLKELTEALRGRHDRTADELCDELLDRFAGDAEDDVVLAVVRVEPD
jgi:hypothetical protein